MIEKLNLYIKGDRKIWGIIVFLAIASILVVFSATADLAHKYRSGNNSFYMFKQLGSMLIGGGIIILISNIPYRYYSRFSLLFLYFSIGLLIIAIFAGVNINEASRWIQLPIIGIRFQPSEFAKIAIIIYVARTLAQHQGDKEALKKSFLPIMVYTLIVVGLIFKDNLSTAVLIFGVIMIMLIIGGMFYKYILGTVGVVIAFFVILLFLSPKVDFLPRLDTWRMRVESFFNNDETEKKDTYQSDQAKIAVATGGIIGKGPGNSEQRDFLPHPYSDFIYAIIAEEYGLWGALLILGAYIYMLKRIGIIVRKSTRAFPAFLTLGLGFLLVSQALINMGVSVGLFPVTGQPLPLVSMGTTSIISTCIAFGAILNISQWNKDEAFKAEEAAEAVNNE